MDVFGDLIIAIKHGILTRFLTCKILNVLLNYIQLKIENS